MLTITASGGEKIYYTLDGSTPNTRSNRYKEPIKIENTSILRAIAVAPGFHPSLPVTATYLIEEELGLPVLSIVNDPENLWDEARGIIHNAWQRGEQWERPAAVSLVHPDGSTVFDFEQDIGLRVHGGASRWVDKKSFRLYWRGGTHLKYPLLPNKPDITRFRRLIVRSGGNDQATGWDGNQTWVMMRCWLLGELWRQAGGNASSHLPVILLLNGEMWGMYNIRERIDRFFLEENFGTDPNNVDLIKYEHPGRATVQEGSIEAWNSLNEFFQDADMTNPEMYKKAHELIEMQNFVDYTIMQIYAGNWDWPQNNVYAFRERTQGARWQWILWDIDDAFMMRSPINHNTLQWGTRDRARRDLAPHWYAEAGATTLHISPVLIDFERSVLLRALQPVVVVEYQREGMCDLLGDGVRVTFDHSLWSTDSEELFPVNPFFSKHFPEHVILEVKSREIPPEWLKRVIQRHGLKLVAYSKYVQAVTVSRPDVFSVY